MYRTEFRELSLDEIELVAGGWAQSSWDLSYYEDIYITGRRGISEDGSWFNDGGEYGGGSGGYSDPSTTNEPYKDCEKDNKALEVRDAINALPKIGLEYGALIYKDASGNVHSGAIASGTSGGVNPGVPSSVGITNILGQIHSHPPLPSTGNAEVDAAYAEADKYPSPDDWSSMQELAWDLLAAGGDPNQLSIYIIDGLGFMREFNWSDRLIYNVPASQLLGMPGYPPPPPLPAPVVLRSICGS